MHKKWLRPLAAFGLCLMMGLMAATHGWAANQNDDLVYHANFGDADTVQATLEKGANPDARNPEGWPAISLAATRNDSESIHIVHMLVEAGANINVRDANGETPLMNAITNNNVDLVRYLLEKGADFYATNSKGRSVLAFAEHYGDAGVLELVKEAIRIEEERVREGRSRKHLYKMLDEFIYYHCAYQYLVYNTQNDFYPAGEKEAITRLEEQVKGRIMNAQMELQYNFLAKDDYLQKTMKTTHEMIFNELENMISNRYRREQGVGTEQDLDKRCKKILNAWRAGFEAYEMQQQQKKNGS